jgi:hypothetical protein
MKDIIHESIYDICIKIYDDICYNNNNCHDNEEILTKDLNNFIEKIMGKSTKILVMIIEKAKVENRAYFKGN